MISQRSLKGQTTTSMAAVPIDEFIASMKKRQNTIDSFFSASGSRDGKKASCKSISRASVFESIEMKLVRLSHFPARSDGENNLVRKLDFEIHAEFIYRTPTIATKSGFLQRNL